MKAIWPALLALALAVLAVVIAPDTRVSRVVDLDLSNSGFRDTFLMMHRSEAERCRVVDRNDSTMRRSDPDEPGRNWDCFRLEAGGEPGDVWLVQSKRKGRGTVFLLPATALDDWSYPFFYGLVRAQHAELSLPAVEWTQLFVDRIYAGLYLRVALPFDLRRKDGGSGILRELLLPGPEGVRAVDTRLAAAGELYRGEVAAGRPPVVTPPPEALRWLAHRNPAPANALLLESRAPRTLALLPLPFDLAALHARHSGRPLVAFRDPHLERWAQRFSEESGAAALGTDAETLEWAFARYADALREALIADAAIHETKPLLSALLPKRQAALAGLSLSLREL